MSFSEVRFRQSVDRALKDVRTILDNHRNPQLPEDVEHSYSDKYRLAEFLTNMMLAGEHMVLEKIGLTPEILRTIKGWASSRHVNIRFHGEETCTYLRCEVVKKESPKVVTEYKNNLGMKSTKTEQFVGSIENHYWKFTATYTIDVYPGLNKHEAIQLQVGRGSVELVNRSSEHPPRSSRSSVGPYEGEITYHLRRLNSDLNPDFRINRDVDSCRTPRRNADIYEAISSIGSLENFFRSVYTYLDRLFAVLDHGLDLGIMKNTNVFNPVIPLFERIQATDTSAGSITPGGENEGNEAAPGFAVVIGDSNLYLDAQRKSFSDNVEHLTTVYPDDGRLVKVQEATIVMLAHHLMDIHSVYNNGIEYIEWLIRKQLIAAIGKVVNSADFYDYMNFHYRKLYRSEFAPQIFSYAVRRPDHYPEGILTIETQDGEPIRTLVSRSSGKHQPMEFEISASTKVVFRGERLVHGWLSHRFAAEGNTWSPSLTLTARARQFSSFILLVGQIGGPDLFIPKAAIVIQNKDDLTLPLDLKEIPSAKEFEASIESLSPEQQRFCRAYRSMQLEHTLLGVLVLQIKPQLEILLNLPYDSLTKEIELTQDILELLMEYHIPSDLMSFKGDENDSPSNKIATVKRYVKALLDIVDKVKKEQLHSKLQERKAQEMSVDKFAMLSNQSYQQQSLLPTVVSRVRGQTVAAAAATRKYRNLSGVTDPVNYTPGADLSEEFSIDYTLIPVEMDRIFRDLDVDGAVRANMISIGTSWQLKYQASLLSKPEKKTLDDDKQRDERNKAFSLLDALTKAGLLSMDDATLHIILVNTHCFDKSVIETVVQDNVNPIEKMERSALIMASVLYGQPATSLLLPAQTERVLTYSPILKETEVL